MSRFFHGDSSSESSSSDEEELYSEGEEAEAADSDEDSEEESGSDEDSSSDDEGKAKSGANKFLKSDDEESEESSDEERPTLVKSAKDKRFEELEATIKSIENAEKINDWAHISSEFDKLNRQVAKLVQSGNTPKVYVKAIADLEDFMNETIAKQKVSTKKMNATNARGLNAVKQRIRRNNKDFTKDIDSYREDKDAFMESEDEEDVAPVEKPKRSRKAAAALDDLADDEGFSTVGKGGKTLQFTPESILKNLRTIVESRGRKNTDRVEQIRVMEKLYEVAQTPYQKIRVLLSLVSTRFDLTSGAANFMPQEQWKLAENEFRSLLDILHANPQMVVLENAEEWEDDEKPPPTPAPGEYLRIPGSIVSFVERLDDELTRSLQHIDPHTAEYIERLSDEAVLYSNVVRGMLYVEMLARDTKLETPQESINRVVMRRLEHVYFKPSAVVNTLEEKTWEDIPGHLESNVTPRGSVDSAVLVRTLCTYLYQHSEGIIRARAMLCHIYFLALHDDYYRARDMMLMSHLQETINNFDVSTQILYNRTLVQVGLCAFRAGLIYEAQNSLQEICGSGRQKELLAQGVMIQRYSQVSPEQERLERQRQLPFHMHINLELLECVYLTSSMLLEIPLLAQTGSSPDIKRRIISKTYRRMLEYHERQIFTGPPENTRDHIMQASKALAAGEWKKSIGFVQSIKIWDLMSEPEKIKQMLSGQVQEEGLRTYLFTYAPFYDTLAVSTLASMFDLSERKVAAVISKMISHEELGAALDQVNSAIIFRKGVELSRLQSLALTLSDKASGLMESNERILEQRTQGTANAFDRNAQGGGRGGRGGGRGGRGRGDSRIGQGGQGGRRPGGTQFTGGALGGSGAIRA
ncbi:MAG: Translation initiation factor 3 subunit c [Caeruleum heppii]|nr:MAG: Translation initiation factor 3 subunit c [Caeruleum heppii]